jgi:anaerobic magnesium-protoporphyrin IX monomethyl ester cyclase
MSKIVLVQPPDPLNTQVLRDHMGYFGILRKKISRFKDNILPPLNLAYSASLLEENGFDVSIIDAPTVELKTKEVLQLVEAHAPDLTVINVTGVSNSHDLDFSSKLKQTIDTTVAVTGPHLTLKPEIALQNTNIDLVIRGEIENTILELSQRLPRTQDVRGIAFRKNKGIVLTPTRQFTNLDDLPFPSYHKLPMKKYRYHLLNKRPLTTVLTSRGCPFKCMYCPYPLGYGNVWRGRSVENVLQEFKLLVEKFKIKSILFRDQIFTFDMQRAEKICDEIIKEDIDIQWRCETRIDRLSKNLMTKMKKAGCSGIHLGIESGDPEVLKYAKAGVNLDLVRKTFREAKEVGIETVAFFLVGLPGETKESIAKTIRLAKEIKSDITWFNTPVPYPGTKLHELAEKNNWIIDKNWENYSGTQVVMRTDHLTAEEIRSALEKAKKMFSERPLNLMEMALSKRGILTILSNPKEVMKYVFADF